jgi:hypothetical protein
VDLWLIVGHGRVISAHTPNICYRASGFEMRAAESSLYPMVFPGQRDAPFLTNTFFKEDISGRSMVRVFWSWYNTENEDHKGEVVWEAPQNSRWYFGNTRALYKMYFTSQMKDPLETAEQSACLRFAREFLPVVNEALAGVHLQESGVADAAADLPAEEVAVESPTESATEEAAADPSGLFGSQAAGADAARPGDAAANEQPAAAPGTSP